MSGINDVAVVCSRVVVLLVNLVISVTRKVDGSSSVVGIGTEEDSESDPSQGQGPSHSILCEVENE